MFLYQTKKAQTSLEFLMVILFLIVISITITFSITDTFDINTAMYKTKNVTLELITVYDNSLYIEGMVYSFDNVNLNIFVNLRTNKKECPSLEYFQTNYGSLEQLLKSATKFDNVNIQITCRTLNLII